MKDILNHTTSIGLILFVLLSVYNIYLDIHNDIKQKVNIENTHIKIENIINNSKIIFEIQKERGLTSIYFENTSAEHFKELTLQRKKTSNVLLTSPENLRDSITNNRILVSKDTSKKLEVFYTYSQIIRTLLLDTQALTFQTNNSILKNNLIVYNDLNFLQEFLGQIRAKVGVVLSANILNAEDKQEIKRRNILFSNYLETTFRNDIITSTNYTKLISKTKCLKKTLSISNKLESKLNPSDINLSALQWFELSSCAVEKINSFGIMQRDIIHKYIETIIKEAEKQRLHNFLFWILGTIILFIYVLIASKKSKELLKEQALLKSYKMAIDYSSVVSKTDKEGVITYVNDAFLALSQYSKEELIGHKHSVVKHPDMPDKIFDDMWDTIMQGKKWNGLIKNKKKDDGVYWADSFIYPIFDDHGELEEYIAIRHDVTEIILLHDEIEETQRELIYRLGEAVESRSKESGNHIKRVAHYSKLLAQLSGLSQEDCKVLFSASSMHDVGKIAIPDSILLKPGTLNKDEWEIMKTHSEIGFNIFKDSQRPILRAAAGIAHEHHERYDGKGYPRSIKGEEICIFGRIVSIADVFDALCSQRTYKKAWPLDDVLKLLKEESGKQFDPLLVRLFLDNIDSFLEIQRKYK